MKRGTFVAAFVALAFWSIAGFAEQKSPPDEAFDRKIEAELRALDPKAADLFIEAKTASERGDLDGAAERLERVRASAPSFVHATRRLCGVEARRGHRDRAIALCREAVTEDRSALNLAALAFALTASKGAIPDADAQEALKLSQKASLEEDPVSAYTQLVLCQSALAARDSAALLTCADRLQWVAPNAMGTHYFSAIAAASQGRPNQAMLELDVAHAQGLPDGPYGEMRARIEASRPPLERWGWLVLRGIIAWLLGLALLVGVGAILSAATLRAVSRVPTESNGRARGLDAALRRAYRVTLWLTCAYYYVSLPIVALVVVGAGAGLLYAFLAAGQIPIKLMLITVVMVFASLWAIAKSVFVRGLDEDPGEKLDLGEHPTLRTVLHDVAGRIGTRPVDAVYLTPTTEIAVFERGGVLAQIRGRSERCLVLGAGVLEGMRVRELKAILAHEYGHFHNEDTAGGGFALAVRRSLMTMILHLVRGGAASWLNPAWWFVRGFHDVFTRVSQGASRLQEVLADRWAAFAYGSDAFARGLAHVVDRSVRFQAHLSATLGEVVPRKEPLTNVYAFVPKEPVAAEKIDEAVSQGMNRAAGPSDSHPPPVDRIAWITKIAASGPEETPGDLEPAWSLLAAREAIEERMTATLRALLATRGIQITSSG